MNILINAYACSPVRGSEPGMGWHWVSEIAKYCHVFVITEGEYINEIEKGLESLPQKDNISFFYNNVSEKVRQICRNQGDWRFYWYYRKWQKKTLEIARRICEENKIDIIHQLNMIGYREPGLLWKISGPKFVWGPVGGMETMPLQYMKGISLKLKASNILKNVINSFQFRFQPNVHQILKRANVVIAATSGCQKLINNFYHKNVILINETGCIIGDIEEQSYNDSGIMNLLWVGKLDFRKQLTLALRVLGKLRDLKVVLHVCGIGSDEQIGQMYKLSENLGISDKLVYHGFVTHDEVLDIMHFSDLFLFTSIMEGTPHVVLEAISNCLPVICFNTCGQGDVVSEDFGRKIELSTPEQSVEEMANIVRELYFDKKKLKELSHNCREASKQMSWESKIHKLLEIYETVLASSKNG